MHVIIDGERSNKEEKIRLVKELLGDEEEVDLDRDMPAFMEAVDGKLINECLVYENDKGNIQGLYLLLFLQGVEEENDDEDEGQGEMTIEVEDVEEKEEEELRQRVDGNINSISAS